MKRVQGRQVVEEEAAVGLEADLVEDQAEGAEEVLASAAVKAEVGGATELPLKYFGRYKPEPGIYIDSLLRKEVRIHILVNYLLSS